MTADLNFAIALKEEMQCAPNILVSEEFNHLAQLMCEVYDMNSPRSTLDEAVNLFSLLISLFD